MTTEESNSQAGLALVRHLVRFPEDLRDIRRLQRKFQLSARDVARALDAWLKQRRRLGGPPLLQH